MSSKNMKKVKKRLERQYITSEETHPVNFPKLQKQGKAK